MGMSIMESNEKFYHTQKTKTGVVIVTINVVQYQKKWDYMELLDNVTKVVEQEFHVRYPIRVVQT